MQRVLAALTTLVAASCGASSRPVATRPPDNSFVVTHVRVFDGTRAIDPTNVVVRDGRIASVGASIPADLRVVDGSGRTLLPGLIDAHGHVTSEAMLHDALRFGVTTVLDMFTSVAFMQAHRTQRDETRRTDAADMYSAGAPVTSAGGMGTQFGLGFPTITGPTEAPAFVHARVAEGSAYIKILYEPDAEIFSSISKDTLAAAVAAAHHEGVLTIVHVTSQQGAAAVVDAGADGLAHIFGNELIAPDLVARIAARHMFVTATLIAHAFLEGHPYGPTLAGDPRLAPYLTDANRAVLATLPVDKNDPLASYVARFSLETATENVRRLHAAGVTILAGDDASNFGPHGVSIHGELELLSHAGLSNAEVLAAATSLPAMAFRLGDRGRIAPGARADLLLVDGNPLADITATRAIVSVFKNGYEVVRAK